MAPTRLSFLLFLTLMLTFTTMVWSQRPTPAPFQAGRSVTFSTHGMVACAHPLAAQIGLDVLKQGGNAMDAAIAVNAALGLMEPTSCGIGGDLFAMVWDAKTQKLYGLNASGRSPYKATRAYFLEKGLKAIPYKGPLSWSVPGCVDGWDQLRQRFGTWSFSQLLKPTIQYAEEGFPVTEVIAGYWRASERTLARSPEGAGIFLIQGRAPRAGTLFKNPLLAKSYREIAEHGRDGYYKGRIAQDIVAFSEKQGGLFSLKDFEDHTSTWVEPVSTNYRGYDVWELPPNGQGIAALQMLNMLEPYDLAKMGPKSADYWHLFLESKKLAFADRAQYYADPEFSKVPVQALISKPYAESRRKLIKMDQAAVGLSAGNPLIGQSDTTYLCVVDAQRNCVSLIQSNYAGFGSDYFPTGLGFGLQNRGTLFSLDEQHPNRLEPHKRPFHTIIPGFVTYQGKPYFVFGVMGGDMQPQGHVQVLNNLIDFNMNVQAAGEAPRLEHLGSASPTGTAEEPQGGRVEYEIGLDPKIVQELTKRGHVMKEVRRNGGGYQGILIDPVTNVLKGGTEARKDGMAIGY